MRKEEFCTLPAGVREYLNYLSGVKSKSDLTIIEYASDIRLFLRFLLVSRKLVDPSLPFDEICVANLDYSFFESITLSDAYAFISYCNRIRNNNGATRARKVVSIKRFFRYLEMNNKISENPMREIESPQKSKTLPKFLTLEQSIRLLSSVEGKHRERDYCILTLFLNCGLRLAELVSVNISDLSEDNSITVRGKGDKERKVYLNDACLAAIRAYMAVRPVDGVRDRDALFISSQMKRISPKTVQHMVDIYLEKAGLDGMGFSVHKLRHTAATLMYRHGNVDVLLLKEILGHENLATTEIYTHVADQQLQQAVDSNPLNSLNSFSPSKAEE